MGRGARRRCIRAVVTAVGAAGVALLVACTPVGAGGVAPTSSPPDTPGAPSPAPTSTLRPDVQGATLPTPAPRVPPVELRIPELGVDMPVVEVGVEPTGQMELPVDPAVAGWYRFGPDAASIEGTVTIAAHVDAVGYPLGPLARLRDVSVGSVIETVAADGSPRAYVVESLTYYEKAALPTGELFARTGPPALVLITCGGPFDSTTGHYRDNVVAIARPR